MSAKIRIAMACALCLALTLTLRVFSAEEYDKLCGVELVPQEVLAGECKEKAFVEQVDNAEELILFEGYKIPYDKNTNRFYITQNMDEELFTGVFSAASDDLRLYFQEDDYASDKASAISEGHNFSVWIMSGERYTVCNVVFTGLPVAALTLDTVNVWNPCDDEVNGLSNKESRAFVKFSESGETGTIKLQSDDGESGKKLSFLDMGKQDTWKLYVTSQKDTLNIRSMLSYTLWNNINSVKELERPCRYVELIFNNEYYGLCIFTPRLDEDFAGMPDGSLVRHLETGNAESDSTESDNAGGAVLPYEDIDFENLCEYYVFTQAVYACENTEDCYLIMESDGAYLAPSKIEYSFGIFPNRLAHFSWEPEKRILTPEEFGITDEELSDRLMESAAELWRSLRKDKLSGETLSEMVSELADELKASGFYARSEKEHTEEGLSTLRTYLAVRMEVLDKYYEAE